MCININVDFIYNIVFLFVCVCFCICVCTGKNLKFVIMHLTKQLRLSLRHLETSVTIRSPELSYVEHGLY